MAYADATYYTDTYGGSMSDPTAYLEKASDDIDILTFYRINAIGFSELTDFQQEQVQKAVCIQADFRNDNEDLFATPFTSYSINGVSMALGNSGAYSVEQGVPVSNTALGILRSTGLMCRILWG